MNDPVAHAQLRDGTAVIVRPVRPTDRGLLLRGFAQLGPTSRYRRFFNAKPELSEGDLRYLTEVDGVQHHAIGAVTLDANGVEQPLGVARYVRDAPDSEVAEPAVAVIDSAQGRGLGKILLRELSSAAYARGVRRFRCVVLSSNSAMRALLRELAPDARLVHRESDVDELELTLPVSIAHESGPVPRDCLHGLLRLAAEQRVSLRAPGTCGGGSASE